MTLLDVTLALLLSARIHRTDAAIKTTAKRCAKQLPRAMRELIYPIINSPEPLKMIANIAEHLDRLIQSDGASPVEGVQANASMLEMLRKSEGFPSVASESSCTAGVQPPPGTRGLQLAGVGYVGKPAGGQRG